jgi:hypothetical protein
MVLFGPKRKLLGAPRRSPDVIDWRHEEACEAKPRPSKPPAPSECADFQEMEIPRRGHARAPGHPTWTVGARARLAASLHQGRHARAGRQASADAVLEHPLVRDAQAITD